MSNDLNQRLAECTSIIGGMEAGSDIIAACANSAPNSNLNFDRNKAPRLGSAPVNTCDITPPTIV